MKQAQTHDVQAHDDIFPHTMFCFPLNARQKTLPTRVEKCFVLFLPIACPQHARHGAGTNLRGPDALALSWHAHSGPAHGRAARCNCPLFARTARRERQRHPRSFWLRCTSPPLPSVARAISAPICWLTRTTTT